MALSRQPNRIFTAEPASYRSRLPFNWLRLLATRFDPSPELSEADMQPKLNSRISIPGTRKDILVFEIHHVVEYLGYNGSIKTSVMFTLPRDIFDFYVGIVATNERGGCFYDYSNARSYKLWACSDRYPSGCEDLAFGELYQPAHLNLRGSGLDLI